MDEIAFCNFFLFSYLPFLATFSKSAPWLSSSAGCSSWFLESSLLPISSTIFSESTSWLGSSAGCSGWFIECSSLLSSSAGCSGWFLECSFWWCCSWLISLSSFWFSGRSLFAWWWLFSMGFGWSISSVFGRSKASKWLAKISLHWA